MSYSGIGLKSAKGSSTSGHVQRSLASNTDRRRAQGSQRQRDKAINKPTHSRVNKPLAVQKEMSTHMEKREIEVQVSELRDWLEDDESLSDEQINEQCETLRNKLTKEWQEQQRVSSLYTSRKARLNEDLQQQQQQE
ncbi:hypothetical protein SEUBUCD646_0B05800 [Saccharomyces eubayanus]|uniref:Pre-mRNA-splicing factor CWC21 n=2 Tax=Saccharomyces TaxID=4930 RepID=A0A6C1E3B1_SACPS|nr:CWC21-like protein [Saccharomyces eubayanus]KOH01287.1 CWC21-like protein [Saccharomyces eubayanus]QID83788.1 RNA-splicing factor [Saccharomyces pastorianus]CAI1861119.1 hypothetical protein SEUBUCD650_0B05800 [Saccharomyces eubayanus]CAI1895373.1 hypothetical protein SEUBUCD646_0B05800 [Saccharomyces eubayanus]